MVGFSLYLDEKWENLIVNREVFGFRDVCIECLIWF